MSVPLPPVPLYDLLEADSTVVGLLGEGSRVRVYPFDEAPQKDKRPYVTWSLEYGTPNNSLACRPDSDHMGIGIEIYAPRSDLAYEIRDAVVAAIETEAYVVSWDGEGRDRETHAYYIAFTVEWIVMRSTGI